MPEAAMHKDHEIVAGQHEVRRARKVGDVRAVPIPRRADGLLHNLLRLRAARLDFGHDRAAVLARELVQLEPLITEAALSLVARAIKRIGM